MQSRDIDINIGIEALRKFNQLIDSKQINSILNNFIQPSWINSQVSRQFSLGYFSIKNVLLHRQAARPMANFGAGTVSVMLVIKVWSSLTRPCAVPGFVSSATMILRAFLQRNRHLIAEIIKGFIEFSETRIMLT